MSTQAKQIFLTLIRDIPEGQREEYLQTVCGGNEELRERVRALLHAHEQGGSFLERPAGVLAQAVGCLDGTQTPVARSLSVADALQSGVLGDYRIRREVGRGGMGVVYEAEQLSLGRTVALKVLPYAAMLDKTQLARFKNEARAAASLDHPNVVHVHAVGVERGVHYYAMQFIDGQTVADLIADHRLHHGVVGNIFPTSSRESLENAPTRAGGMDPVDSSSPSQSRKDTSRVARLAASTWRDSRQRDRIDAVVQLAIQAAKALEHAHQMGVVHRDIKPSNLLVDAERHLWVADFGLAMVEAEGNLTTSGSMLGTLRYMSPEQIRGDRHVLDHHTDIYSLGATLYEMFTLQPAFAGADAPQLMRRIAHEDPLAPRKLNSAIPRDLETIVLKAMSKDHEDRYTTAGDMAADLQRFLDDQPIRARPPGAVERARKWARRHCAVVTTAAITLLVAVAVAGTLLWQERGETFAALQRESDQRERAEKQEAAAVAARQESEQSLAAALDAVDKLLQHASRPELREIPQLQPIRQKVLEDVLAFYEKFRTTTGDSEAVRFRAARTWQSLAELASDLGNKDAAHHAFDTALAALENLSQEFPQQGAYQDQFLGILLGYGYFHLRSRGDANEARRYFERARRRAEQLLDDTTVNRPDWVQTQLLRKQVQALLALAAAQDSRDDATHQDLIRTAYKAATGIDNAANQDLIVELESQMAFVQQHADPQQAEEYFEQAIAGSRRRTQETPTRFVKSWHTNFLIEALPFFERSKRTRAKELAEEAVEMAASLVAEFPSIPLYRVQLRVAVTRCIEMLPPDTPPGERERVIAGYVKRFADQEWVHSLHAERLADGPDPVAALTKAIEQFPDQSAYYRARGIELGRVGRARESAADLDRAIQLLSVDGDPRLYVIRGELLARRRQFDEAMADFRTAFSKSDTVPKAVNLVSIASRSLSQNRQFEEALAVAQLAAEKSRMGYLVHLALCEAKLGLHRDEEALRISQTPSIGLATRGGSTNDVRQRISTCSTSTRHWRT